MTLILGVNAFHPDASACLLRDGKLIAAVAEERLGNRAKHIAGFPSQAIRSVLREAAADVKDIDFVALGHDHNSNLGAKIAHVAAHPVKTAANVISHFARRAHTKSMSEQIAEACGARADECRFKVLQVEHHLAHIASSFFCSDFDEAAGFSYDGSGDFVTAMYARCAGNKIEILDRVYVPHSLGYFYTALCQFIGFDKFGEEYKVMGLAAYGAPKFRDAMAELLRVAPDAPNAPDQRPRTKDQLRTPSPGRTDNQQPITDNKFHLNRNYFKPLGKNLEECIDEHGEIVLPPLYSEEFIKLFGAPRQRGSELAQRDKDLAASCQAHFEQAVLASLLYLHR